MATNDTDYPPITTPSLTTDALTVTGSVSITQGASVMLGVPVPITTAGTYTSYTDGFVVAVVLPEAANAQTFSVGWVEAYTNGVWAICFAGNVLMNDPNTTWITAFSNTITLPVPTGSFYVDWFSTGTTIPTTVSFFPFAGQQLSNVISLQTGATPPAGAPSKGFKAMLEKMPERRRPAG